MKPKIEMRKEVSAPGEWPIILFLLAMMFFCAWCFSGCASQKPVDIAWDAVTPRLVVKDGKLIGCFQEGHDANGFERWSVALCPASTNIPPELKK